MNGHPCTFDRTCEYCFIKTQPIEDVLDEFGEVEIGMTGAGLWPLECGFMEVHLTLDDGRALTIGEPDGPFSFKGYGWLIRRPTAIGASIYESHDALMEGADPLGSAEVSGLLVHDFLHGLRNLVTVAAAS